MARTTRRFKRNIAVGGKRSRRNFRRRNTRRIRGGMKFLPSMFTVSDETKLKRAKDKKQEAHREVLYTEQQLSDAELAPTSWNAASVSSQQELEERMREKLRRKKEKLAKRERELAELTEKLKPATPSNTPAVPAYEGGKRKTRRSKGGKRNKTRRR